MSSLGEKIAELRSVRPDLTPQDARGALRTHGGSVEKTLAALRATPAPLVAPPPMAAPMNETDPDPADEEPPAKRPKISPKEDIDFGSCWVGSAVDWSRVSGLLAGGGVGSSAAAASSSARADPSSSPAAAPPFLAGSAIGDAPIASGGASSSSASVVPSPRDVGMPVAPAAGVPSVAGAAVSHEEAY